MATPTAVIYTLSLHDALPISATVIGHAATGPRGTGSPGRRVTRWGPFTARRTRRRIWSRVARDRKSTRLNSSHLGISYAVFCLKKKKNECEVITPKR